MEANGRTPASQVLLIGVLVEVGKLLEETTN